MKEYLEHNNLISKWLKGELSNEENQKLESDEEFNDLKFVLEDIGTWKLKNFDVQKGYIDLKKRNAALHNPRVKKIQLRSLLTMAAAIVFIVVTYFTWNTFVKSHDVKYATTIGETKIYELPDGSRIQLDALSEIIYNTRSWENERNIYLNGQAFFEVKEGRPFIVKSSQGSVQVLGTQFNVLGNKKTLEVMCFEGKVEVKTLKGNAILTKGKGVKFDENKLTRFELDSISPDWLQGYTIYKDTQLSLIIEDLKKYYNVDIKLPRKYSKIRFSGKVPHHDLKLALKTIFVPIEITYTLSDDEGKVIF